jgi:hypothetical protein
MLFPKVLGLIGLSVLISGAEQTKFIRADIANLRKKPTPTSELTFRVRINSPVVEKKRNGDWSLVKFGRSTEGWVQSILLGDAPYSRQGLLDSLAGTPEKAKWAGRLVSAFPEEENHWDRLHDAFKEAGDTKGMAMINAHREGKEVAYIAQCYEGEIQLVGKIDTSGTFSTFAWRNFGMDVEDQSKKARRGKAVSTTGQRWYGVEGPVPDTMFAELTFGPTRPFMKRLAKARPSYHSFLDSDEGPPQWYSLGPCRGNQVFTTRPIRKAMRKPATRVDMHSPKYWGKMAGKDTTAHPVKDPNLMIKTYPDVGFTEVFANFEFHGHYGPTQETFTRLFDEKGDVLYPKNDQPGSIDYLEGSKKWFNDTQFFSFQSDPKGIIYGMYLYMLLAPEGAELNLELLRIEEGKEAQGLNVLRVYSGG